MKPKVYLAGKINGYADWRDGAVMGEYGTPSCDSGSGLGNVLDVDVLGTPTMAWSRRSYPEFDAVGPYFIGCKHACPNFNGCNSIAGCGDSVNGDYARDVAATLAIRSVRHADFVFAWLNASNAHGTLVEIGYALGLGKPVYLAGPRCECVAADEERPWEIDRRGCPRCDSWFPWHAPGVDVVDEVTPRAALLRAIGSWQFRNIKFDSPVEKQFWTAYGQTMPTALDGLTPQHEVGRYRLDFAIPTKRFGIEVDGLAYHNGQETFIADRRRQRELEGAGWRIVRFAAKEVMDDAAACVRQAAALAARP